MSSDPVVGARLLVVDDEPANVTLLEELLGRWGVEEVVTTTESSKAVDLCDALRPNLVLLDLLMPAPDGFAVMESLRARGGGRGPPVLVLTGDITREARRRALELGARDFVTKPFDAVEVELRVRNLLAARRYELDLELRAGELERRVRARTGELERARLEVLERLALASEYRDDDTGEHTLRVAFTAGMLARALGLADDMVRLIALAAPLHDVGKIGVPDAILLKPGRLDPAEWTVMRDHVGLGARILGGSDSPLLQLAEEIALRHHERWDGTGYPDGLAGEETPLSGRIVAVADVFDALLCERPYKAAWPLERARAEIVAQAGRQFDPRAVDAFGRLDHAVLAPASQASPATTADQGGVLAMLGLDPDRPTATTPRAAEPARGPRGDAA